MSKGFIIGICASSILGLVSGLTASMIYSPPNDDLLFSLGIEPDWAAQGRYPVYRDENGRRYYETNSTTGGGFLEIKTHTERHYLEDNEYPPYRDFSKLESAKKPVIYVYNDTDDKNISISVLNRNESPDIVYPKLSDDNAWHISANKDGVITIDSREYNYLYWEDSDSISYSITNGYCVKGEDTIEFFESALSDLGLTDKEQADFITYWLPQMQGNAYNIISFNPEEYFEAYQHIYDRVPDNEITAFMIWEPSDKYVELQAQDLLAMNNHSRDGLVIVEWGGTKLEDGN